MPLSATVKTSMQTLVDSTALAFAKSNFLVKGWGPSIIGGFLLPPPFSLTCDTTQTPRLHSFPNPPPGPAQKPQNIFTLNWFSVPFYHILWCCQASLRQTAELSCDHDFRSRAKSFKKSGKAAPAGCRHAPACWDRGATRPRPFPRIHACDICCAPLVSVF